MNRSAIIFAAATGLTLAACDAKKPAADKAVEVITTPGSGSAQPVAAEPLMSNARQLFKVIPDTAPVLPGNAATPARLELGKMLFFEPRLAASHSISCSSCHNIGLGGTDNEPTSIGHHWQRGGRNSPTVLNVVFNTAQFWDGRAGDLEAQAGGGGGSILAVPLMVYLVGVPNPHVAIGTSALAVAANAAANLVPHARNGVVKWRCAGIYAAAGVAGAWGGSSMGKAFDGQKLLFLFALLMLVVGGLMLRGRNAIGNPAVRLNRENAPKIVGFGAVTGLFSGLFGIGGGFLIVPGLIASSGMPMINAVGSSLVAVTAFGLTTSVNYAASGLIDWSLAAVFIGGGIVGGMAGAKAATLLSAHKGLLNGVFAGLIFIVAAYMLWKSASAV